MTDNKSDMVAENFTRKIYPGSSCQVCGKKQGYIEGEPLGDCSLSCISSHIKSREAFESWYADGNVDCPSLEKQGDGYKLMQAHQAWLVWRAAWNLQVTLQRRHDELMRVAEGMRDALDRVRDVVLHADVRATYTEIEICEEAERRVSAALASLAAWKAGQS